MSASFLTKISHAIKKEKPDILAFTGDFLCYSCLEDPEGLGSFLSELTQAPFGNFAVLGNHDYSTFVSIADSGNYALSTSDATRSSILKGFERLFKPIEPTGLFDPEIASLKLHQPLLELISKTHFTLLHNSSRQIAINDSTVNIVGLGEYSAGKMNESEAIAGLAPGDFTLTLLHNPDGALHLKHSSDLILSGHTHGNQVNLPILRNRFIIMEDPKLCKGLIRFRDQWIYVSKGVGSVMPFRWFSPPEIVSITLEST